MQVPAASERRKHAPPATASTIHITCAACSHLHTHIHLPIRTLGHGPWTAKTATASPPANLLAQLPYTRINVHSTAQRLTALRPLQQHNRKLHATEFDSTSTPSEKPRQSAP
ncbi:hypothetical protein ECG_06021 [Echinococcus granulosus]|nr:hypothetical protein ECG_06021 [Echinococcus granulosus]